MYKRQPRNLLDLYSWGKVLGLEIVAAGKASEYDFVWDPDTNEFTYMEGTEKPHENIPGMKEFWHYKDRETLDVYKRQYLPRAESILIVGYSYINSPYVLYSRSKYSRFAEEVQH